MKNYDKKNNMSKLITFFWKPHIFGLGIAAFSLLALSAALTAQYVFDMQPCVLCIYQRIPFVINVILGIGIFVMARKGKSHKAAIAVLIAGIVFIINSAIAFYHVGVEQLWWESALEGCKFDPSKIREAAFQPPVPCNIIPWELYGISMAGFNVIFCGIAGIKCVIAGMCFKKSA